MDIQELAKRLEGMHTVTTIAKTLNISRRTAVNYVSELRKKGFVEVLRGKRKVRMYKIRTFKKLNKGYPGLIETINTNSKVKIVSRYDERVYTHKLTVEEAVVKAVLTREFRVILASLGLFNKIKDWHLLNKFAVEYGVEREIGTLYDTAREVIKVRRMDERTRKSLLLSKAKNKFIINGLRSKDFQHIEKIWNIKIPFNKSDLEVYKE